MLDIIIWIVIVALFIASFAGVIFPIIPSPLVLWVGFLLYHFVINADELTVWFWMGMAVLTVILIVADVIANSYFVKIWREQMGRTRCSSGCYYWLIYHTAIWYFDYTVSDGVCN